MEVGNAELSTGKWTAIKFSTSMTEPVVFTSPPNVETNNFGMVMIGDVKATGFSARMYFPSCASARGTGSGTKFPFHWLAVESTSEGYFDGSTKQQIDWTAHVATISWSGTLAARTIRRHVAGVWENRAVRLASHSYSGYV